MACALASALTEREVRHDVAMTGEITLRGRVLPVGGIKEKVLAAHRAGIKTIILPKDNNKDLEEIPSNVKNQLEFILVEHMDEVLERALAKKKYKPKVHDTAGPAIQAEVPFHETVVEEGGPQMPS